MCLPNPYTGLEFLRRPQTHVGQVHGQRPQRLPKGWQQGTGERQYAERTSVPERSRSHPARLARQVPAGGNDWINDLYWLVMPFKLKDSGVTLKCLGEDTTATELALTCWGLRFKAWAKRRTMATRCT